MAIPTFIYFDTSSECLPEMVTAPRTLSWVSTQHMRTGLTDLVKARTSQVNGCAHCLQLHLNWAHKAGVPLSRIDLLTVRHEASDFTDRERVTLVWTEALTDLNCRG